MCESTDDCNAAAGEVCDIGMCWGNPPAERFAAVLVPPAGRTDLPVAAAPLLSITTDGWVSGLDFPEAVAVRGRVILACPPGKGAPPYPCGDAMSVGAQIVIEGEPRYPGGRPYSRVVSAMPGVGPGQDGFSFLLPRDPNADYRITIQPDDSVGGDAFAPGRIAPPRQIAIAADRDRRADWIIGTPGEGKAIRGCVQDILGMGALYAGMKVTAYGRWTEGGPLERASSRSLTDERGCFDVSVPRKMLHQLDLSIEPVPGVALPSFTLRGEIVPDPPDGEEPTVHVIDPPLTMPAAPVPTQFRLPVQGQRGAGGQEPAVGATVSFRTTFEPPLANGDRDVEIRFEAEAMTGPADSSDAGVAVLDLYPGDLVNRRYLVSVVPPVNSELHSVFEEEIAIGIGGAEVLEPLALERRTAVTGLVLRGGEPVVNAPIEARPSWLFRKKLDQAALKAAVEALPDATATTDADGTFLVWLDRRMVGQSAAYDIDLKPSVYSNAPNWTLEDIAVPDDGQLGDHELPEASYARAQVKDQNGEPVRQAEIYIYELPPEASCTGDAMVDCDAPAKLRGVWGSDDDGWVQLVLPRR